MISIMAWTREFIRSVYDGEATYYIGKIDNAREWCIGIYGNNAQPRFKAIGTESSYSVASVQLLYHCAKNAREAEQAARELYAALVNRAGFDFGRDSIGYAHCFYIELPYDEPIFLGTDDNGVYEYHVAFNIYYKEITN